MAIMRRMKILVLVFAFLVLFAGGFTIFNSTPVDASYACCIWVMYCTQNPPIICWDVCIPVPCF